MTNTEKIEMEDYVRHLFNIKREILSQHLKENGRDGYYNEEVEKHLRMQNAFGDTCTNPFK